MARSTSKAATTTPRSAMPAFAFAWVALGLMGVAAILAFAKQDIAAICLVGVAGILLIGMCIVEVRAFRTLQSQGPQDFFERTPEGGGQRSSSTHLPMS